MLRKYLIVDGHIRYLFLKNVILVAVFTYIPFIQHEIYNYLKYYS